MGGAQSSYLADGQRLHLHHGPIDLIVGVDGAGRTAALARAARRFETVLDELVPELPVLRAPVTPATQVQGDIAAAMLAAVAPYSQAFITPMAAVAGAVGDAVLEAVADGAGIATAYVNNGGDVAIYLAPGEALTAAVAAIAADMNGRVSLTHASPVRGVATSGWRGRSQSLGIADAVTVLARSGAQADAAATMIANAVDLPDSPKISRVAARTLSPDSDLGARLVTVDVAHLSPGETAAALDRGQEFALACLDRNLICAALLTLGGQQRLAGSPALLTLSHKDPVHA